MLKRSYLYCFSDFVGVGLQNVSAARVRPERAGTRGNPSRGLPDARRVATLFIRPGRTWNGDKDGKPQILLHGSVIL
jgi:hypothetical protein